MGGSEEPEEGDYDEVADMSIECSPARVGEVEEFGEGLDDHDIGRAGSEAGIVFVAHDLEKRCQ